MLSLLTYGTTVKKKLVQRKPTKDLKHLITTSLSKAKTLPAQFHCHLDPPKQVGRRLFSVVLIKEDGSNLKLLGLNIIAFRSRQHTSHIKQIHKS